MAKRKYLLDESAGPSIYPWKHDFINGVELTCHLCGDVVKAKSVGLHGNYRHVSYLPFLGLNIVKECCGKVLDVVYAESGEAMTLRFLGDFADNPTDEKYSTLIEALQYCLRRTKKKLQTITQEVNDIEQEFSAVEKELKSAQK